MEDAPLYRKAPTWGYCLFVLNCFAMMAGSLPLLLWMAPPNPMTYLLAPVALAVLLGEPTSFAVIGGVALFVVILSFWLGQKRFWWILPLALFAVSLAHSFMAIQAFHGLAG